MDRKKGGANHWKVRDFSNYEEDMRNAGVELRDHDDDYDGVQLDWGPFSGVNAYGKSDEEQKELKRIAMNMFRDQILPTLKHGDHVFNRPLSDSRAAGDEEQQGNKRADLYQKYGFGPLDDRAGQHGVIGADGKINALGPAHTEENPRRNRMKDHHMAPRPHEKPPQVDYPRRTTPQERLNIEDPGERMDAEIANIRRYG